MPTRIDAGPGDPEVGFSKGVWVMGRFQSGEGYSRRSNCTRAVSTTRRVAADARLEDRCGGAADFAVGAGEGGAPFAVQFDGSAGGDSDRTAVAYAWDFGERWHWPPPHFGGDGSPSEGCRIGPPSC